MKEKNSGSCCWVESFVNKLVFLNITSRLTVQLLHRAGVTITMQQCADNKSGVQNGFIRKGLGYQAFVERGGNSHVSDFSILPELRKYCGFSMTGIFVIPMITASGPISEDDGVLLPLETWWRGLAESSSLLMTEEEPRDPQRKRMWRGKRRRRAKSGEEVGRDKRRRCVGQGSGGGEKRDRRAFKSRMYNEK